MNDSGKTIMALLAGVVAGAAIGILLAPRKGSETVGMIGDTTRRFSDNLKSKVSDSMDSVNEWKEKITDRVTGGSGMTEQTSGRSDSYTSGGRNI